MSQEHIKTISDPTSRCIYVQAPLTDNELRIYLEEILQKARARYTKLKGIDIRFHTNMYTTKDDNLCGYGFVWVSEPTFGAAMCGLNLDGSERIQTVVDPRWEYLAAESSSKKEELLSELVSTLSSRIEAATEVDQLKSLEEELSEVKQIQETGKLPTLTQKLPGLLDIDPVECDEFQSAVMKSLHSHMGNVTEVEVPDEKGYYTPKFKVAHAYPAKPGYHHNQLIAFAEDLPRWVTPEMILYEANRYRTTSKKVEVVFKGRDRKRILITFDPRTQNAIFARLFLKNLVLTHADQEYLLSFTFAKIPASNRGYR